MNIGIIGAGNMGSAIIKGLVNEYDAKDIYVKGHRVSDRLKNFQAQAGFTLLTNDNLGDLDALFVTTPAPVTIAALKEIKIPEKTIIISAAQGVTADEIHKVFPKNSVFCIIPNIPVTVNAGCISMEETNTEDENDLKTANEILTKLGTVITVPKEQAGIAGTIGGCGPAFVDLFMDALVDAGVQNGMDRPTAQKISEAMVTGSGKLALESELSPADLKDQVTSPGGSTIRGVVALDANKFRDAVNQAVNKANE